VCHQEELVLQNSHHLGDGETNVSEIILWDNRTLPCLILRERQRLCFKLLWLCTESRFQIINHDQSHTLELSISQKSPRFAFATAFSRPISSSFASYSIVCTRLFYDVGGAIQWDKCVRVHGQYHHHRLEPLQSPPTRLITAVSQEMTKGRSPVHESPLWRT
jgi:hypothetical protein